MKKIHSILAASILAVALVPFFAGAQSVADLQTQIQTLISQISSLQQTIPTTSTLPAVVATPVTNSSTSVGAGVTPSGATGVNVTNLVCPIFHSKLSPGDSGAAITALQKFLITQGLLSSDSATGFFGALTQAAVQNFQSAQNIVSSGTPQTTGYGSVGTRTSAMIVQVCSSAVPATPVTPTTPISGQAGMCTAVAISCPAGTHDQVGADCSHTCTSAPASSSACSVYLPPTTSCSSGWQPKVDANGCTSSYSCTPNGTQAPASGASSSTSCPVYNLPLCTGGTLQWQGTGSNGCNLGYQCITH